MVNHNIGLKYPLRTLIAACFASIVVSSAIAAERGDLPATAKTKEEIAIAADRIKGVGLVQTAEFHRVGRTIFAIWYCPVTNFAACYLRVYYYDLEKAKWIRFVERFVEFTRDLSPEMPCPTAKGEEVIVFRNAKGEIVLKESLAELPRQPFH